MKKYSIFLIILSAAILFSPFLSYAQTNVGGNKEEIDVLNKEIAARKDKIKQLEDTIEKYRKNIVQKQTEAQSLKNQLSILDNHIAQLDLDINVTGEKIRQTQLEIDALLLTIDNKEAGIARQKRLITAMIKNVHANDQKNYLEIALTYDNFSDFYNELRAAESVYVDLGRSVKALRIAKEELDAKKAQVVGKKKTLEDLRLELENKRAEVGNEVTTKQTLLIETKGREKQYQTLLSSLRQQYQIIEGEVRTFEDRVRKKLEEEDKIKDSVEVLMIWPTPSHYINSTFHDPEYPYRRVFEHSGIDLRAAQGTPIKAAAAGYVARARRCTLASCYAYVLIVHTGNLSTLYGHLSQITITDDAFVNRGDVIGYSGGTPRTVGAGPFVTGPHLHFETRLNGIPVDPLGYLVQ